MNEFELDIDFCDENASYTNTDGSYKCTCGNGYFSDGRSCSDINECSTGNHNCDINKARCNNFIGSFGCECKLGYVGRDCRDVVECK